MLTVYGPPLWMLGSVVYYKRRKSRAPHASRFACPVTQTMDVHPAFMRLFKSLFWAVLALHIFAGMWFMIADQELAADPTMDTWLSRVGYQEAPVHSQYIISVWFMLSTFTQLGIGDIAPR